MSTCPRCGKSGNGLHTCSNRNGEELAEAGREVCRLDNEIQALRALLAESDQIMNTLLNTPESREWREKYAAMKEAMK